MRLLFLSTEFPNKFDSTKATFNFDLMRSLSVDHEIEIVSPIPWTEELRGYFCGINRATDVPNTRLHITNPRYYFIPKIFREHFDKFLWWSLCRTITRLKSLPKPDCILSYWAHPDGAVAVKLAKQLATRSVIMVGGSDVLLMAKHPRRRKAIKAALVEADAIITVSEDLKRHITELGIANEKVHVVRRGVDALYFHSGNQVDARNRVNIPINRKIGLWVGRLVDVKGVDTLINAMQCLQHTFPEFHLYLIGDGPLKNKLVKQAISCSVLDRIHFVGKVPHEELGDWFRAADVTVLPSLSEGVPNTLLESLACGTPFVASNVGGIPEISNHSAASLFPPNDCSALCEQLAFMLENPPHVAMANRPGTLADFAREIAEIAAGDNNTQLLDNSRLNDDLSEQRGSNHGEVLA